MLKGRVAVVTGSTSGIGLAVAETLARAGAAVCINGLWPRETQAAGHSAEQLSNDLGRRHGVQTMYHGADMTKRDEIADMMREASSRLGPVDIVVNNAGVQHVSPVVGFDPARWQWVMDINLNACFHTSQLALPSMLQRRWGRLVHVASVHGLVGSANKSAYVAAKHGLIGFSKVVALETAGRGVTSNCVCPGWVLTPLVQAQIDAKAAAESISVEEATVRLLSEKQPSKQFATPQQIGETILFLCSDGASQITGTQIPVDGGWTAQ
jgi:3-hydroxybutyrate dehydrogenase